MSFHDLPPEWELCPVSDPRRAADVLDLFVAEDLRLTGAIYLLLCDAQDRVLQPCAVEMVPVQAHGGSKERFFSPFVEVLTRLVSGGGILVALARPTGLSITAADQQWQRAAHAVCSAAGARLLGVHVITPHGSRALPAIGGPVDGALDGGATLTW